MSQLTGGTGRPSRRRAGWLLPVLLVLLIAVPIAEIWLLIQVGQVIGAGWTILILIAEAALGAWLVRREGARTWTALQKTFEARRMPTAELANAALVLVGGCLLLFPGFLTDVVGLFFLLPFTRPWARHLLGLIIAGRIRRAGVDVDVIRAQVDRQNNIEGESTDPASGTQPGQPRRRPDDPEVIRGEVEP